MHRKQDTAFQFSAQVRQNQELRRTFNELTRKTFGFDFAQWYASGHWSDLYVPHVLHQDGRVVSNVSVNHMVFDVCGEKKHYIQLGTVMTDPEYRGRGLNRTLMERVLSEYEGKTDGIYLFANDTVLDYYPKFGFRPAKEYEYYLPCAGKSQENSPYLMQKADTAELSESLCPNLQNPNDGMYMSENMGLYWFWLDAEWKNNLYFLPEPKAWMIARPESRKVTIYQIFGTWKVDPFRLAASFGDRMEEMVLGYTPVSCDNFLSREYRKEDTTLFILGEDLQRMEQEKRRFPALSHA